MATTDVDRLAVLIEANTRSYERAMARIEQKTNQALGRAGRSAQTLDRTLMGVSQTAATFMASFARGAGIAALTALPYTMGRAVSAVADLGNAANRAGVSAEGLQVFRRALEQNGATARDADEAMRRLTRRLGEFANSGAGPAKAAIEGLGLEVFDLDGNLRASEDVLMQIARRFGEIENPAIQSAYAAQLFGDDAGPRLVPLLGQGEQALAGFRRQLEETNTLLSNDSVQAAIEIEDAYNRLIGNMSLRWQDFVVKTVQGAQTIIENIRAVTDPESTVGLQYRLTDLNERIAAAEANERRQLGDLAAVPRNIADATLRGTTQGTFITQIRRELGDMRAERREIEASLAGQLRSTEQYAARARDTFVDLEIAATQAAHSAGSAFREAQIDDPVSLLSERMEIAESRAQDLQTALMDVARSGIDDVTRALDDGKITWEEWAQIGLNAVQRLLDSFGQMSGGRSGGLADGIAGFIGRIFGGGGGGSLFGPGSPLPIYHSGTSYVPQTGPAILQRGEAVIPASMNRGGAYGAQPITVRVINQGEPVEARVGQQRQTSGGMELDVIIDQIAADKMLQPGSRMNSALTKGLGVKAPIR